MDHNARIEAVISGLESQSRINFTATTRKLKVERTTLANRFKGETGTKRDATFYTHRYFIEIQEETLIRYINKLSNRDLFLIL